MLRLAAYMLRLAAWVGLGCGCAFGQSGDSLTFDAAVVKPVAPGTARDKFSIVYGQQGGPGTDDPGRMSWGFLALSDLLTSAYDVKLYQLIGPEWLKTERFDIRATLPPNSTKEQARIMLGNLLTDRFGIKMHRESKVFEVEELTVAKGGPKLKETNYDPRVGAAQAINTGADGVPRLTAPGIAQFMRENPNGEITSWMIARAQTMAEIAERLSNRFSHPVIDKTGLTGKYDFSIGFAPDDDVTGGADTRAGAPSDPGSNQATAVQQQLGLKLTKAKTSIEVIVIDRAERSPREN